MEDENFESQSNESNQTEQCSSDSTLNGNDDQEEDSTFTLRRSLRQDKNQKSFCFYYIF